MNVGRWREPLFAAARPLFRQQQHHLKMMQQAPRVLTARGQVGPRPCDLRVTWLRPDTARLECRNNTAFWLVVDVDSRAAHGVVKGPFGAGTAMFGVKPVAGGVRVNHPLAPWFWVELITV